MQSIKRSFSFLVVGGTFLVSSIYLGGIGGCGSNVTRGASSALRDLKGTLSSSGLSSLKIKGVEAAVACEDVKLCCTGGDGSLTTEKVDSSCKFNISLPLESYCYCGFFSGADADDNGCPDTYVGSLGCSEEGYGGTIPIYPDDDDTTDAIDTGTVAIQGRKLIPTTDPCSQVDSDNDGTDDFADSDDDGDDVLDDEDRFNAFGCENADEFDSDGDNTPDIYEALWATEFAALKLKKTSSDTSSALEDFLTDADEDNIPDGCDVDYNSVSGCTADEFDTDGDCIPDSFDECEDDGDGDGVPYCVDCDDSNAESDVECYDTDYCAIDSDNDGFSLCDDCDDNNDAVTYECFEGDFCATDTDQDGYDFCLDCDDNENSVTTQCYEADVCSLDGDGDGFNLCTDCDDFDTTITTECLEDIAGCETDADHDGYFVCFDCDDTNSGVTSECYEEEHEDFDSCETSTCHGDFDCQLFADDDETDEFKTDNVQCVEGCCALK